MNIFLNIKKIILYQRNQIDQLKSQIKNNIYPKKVNNYLFNFKIKNHPVFGKKIKKKIKSYDLIEK